MFDTPQVYDFLSNPEVEGLRLQVYKLKDKWIQFHPNAYTLGKALYLSRAQGGEITSENRMMSKQFSNLYSKTIRKLEDIFGITGIEVASDISTPGFHIFKGPCGFVDVGRMHKDTSIFEYNRVDDNWIYSFSVLLENINNPPAHLLYKYNDKECSHAYELGKINIWNAFMPHKIGGVNGLSDTEHRITYQGHIVKVRGKYKIYF